MIDLVKIKVSAGHGGSGAVSFLTLKNMRHGKPDGGDGGSGGSIFLESSAGIFDLEDFRRKANWKAGHGENGAENKKKGKDGDDLVLKVPIGTIVTLSLRGRVNQGDRTKQCRSDEIQIPSLPASWMAARNDKAIFDLTEPGQKILLVRGGQGGRGNSHAGGKRDKKGRRPSHWDQFNVAQKGRSGEEQEVQLELKYLAQIGIIGLPNVGKSTLLSVLTNAHPKIADYPFTTLEPNLGVLASGKDQKIIIADIPGIIAGAAMGKGLGFQFLRHIERTKLLIHILDAKIDDPFRDFETVRGELKLYGKDLEKKKEIVVINKIDLVEEKVLKQIKEKFKRKKIFFISAENSRGIEELKRFIIGLV